MSSVGAGGFPKVTMANSERMPKPEDSTDRPLVQSRHGRFRDSGFFRHSSFVIRILVRAADHLSATRPTPNQRWLPFAVLLLLMCNGCAHLSSKPAVGAEQQVRAVLDSQVRAWNAGDLRGFMEGYARSDQTRFQSGGDVSLGWQTVFDRYQKRYSDRARMGILKFSEVEVTTLAPDVALAFGRWRLERAQDAPSGLFTLLFRRTSSGWKIVHDHTSAVESTPPSGKAGGMK